MEIDIFSIPSSKGFYTLLNMVEQYIKAEGLTGKRKKDIRMELEKPIWTAYVSWTTAEYE